MFSSVNSDYNNDIKSWSEIERQLTNIARAGFTHIQWIHDWDGYYMYSPSEMRKAAALLRDLGLNSHSLHASEGCVRGRRRADGRVEFFHRQRLLDHRKDYTSEDEELRQAGVDLLRNRINMCEAIGAHAMVLHMQLPFEMLREDADKKERYYEQAMKSFRELENEAKIAGVRIALENLPGTPQEDIDECFERMFNAFSDSYMGMCYDSGHATLQLTHDPLYFLEKYNDRLFATHLQDNDGITPEGMDDENILGNDKHRVPFTGVCDWEGIARLVAMSPIELPADFEVGITAESEEEELRLLVECREASERFHKMVGDKGDGSFVTKCKGDQ